MSFNEGWKEYKIGNVVEVNPNSINSIKKNLDYINYLKTGNLNTGKIEELEYFEINDENIPSRAKRVVQKNDIIYSTVRPKQKHYGIINKKYDNLIVSTGFVVLSPDSQKIIPEFLYRYLTQEKIVEYLHNVAETSTSAYPSITSSVIEKLKIKAPSLKEQKKIANILSTLDKKIENNNKMNKTLEEMAQAIYKSWFVDFEPFQDGEFIESELGMIPEGWEVISFDDLFEFQKGKTPENKIKEKKEGYLKYLTISVLSGKKTVYGKPTEKNILVNENDVLMVMDGSRSGKIFFGTSGIVASTLAKLNIINDKISNGFIYLLAKYYEKEFMKNTTGSAVPHADKKYILNKKIAIPKNKNLLSNFNKSINDIRTKISLNREENHSLKELRDSLLPKLMSGEIRVPLEEDKKEVK